LQIEGRPADDLQNVGGGRLLFQRFLQLALAGLLGLNEARVFNGDDRLVREGVDELDLAFGEWADRTPCNAPTHKRYCELSKRTGGGDLPMMRDEAQTIAKHLKDHCRATDSTSASSTFRRSRADRLMTFKSSAVAVCCSRASVSSLFRPVDTPLSSAAAKPPECLREEVVACPNEPHFPWDATTRIVFFPKQIAMGRGMTDR
jgi:hypothetical protein